MRIIVASAAACLLLLAATGTTPATAQAAEEPLIEEASTATIAAVERPAAPTAVDRLKPAAGSTLLLPPAPYRPGLPPAPAVPSGLDPAPHALVQQDRRGGLTWLLVGASLVVAGVIVDGDAGTAMSVGGALIGVYGVYLLVRD